MADERSVLTMILEAQDRATGVLTRILNAVGDTETGIENLSGAQRRAAADRSYANSADFLIDRLLELEASSDRARRSIQTLQRGSMDVGLGEYRKAIEDAWKEIDKLEIRNEKLTTSQKDVRTEMEKTSKSGSFLTGIYKRLLAAALLFVSARQIKRFFTESVRSFIESEEGGEKLEGRLKSLKDAWWSLKATVGAIIVEMFNADEEAGTLTTTIDKMRVAIDENRDHITAWANVIGVVIKRVGGFIGNFVQLVFNAQQLAGAALAAMVGAVIDGIVKIVNEGSDALNSFVDFYNDLPRLMRGPSIQGRAGQIESPIPPEFRGKALDEMRKQATDAMSALAGMGENVAGAFEEIPVALRTALAATKQAARDFKRIEKDTKGGAGGPAIPGVPEEVARPGAPFDAEAELFARHGMGEIELLGIEGTLENLRQLRSEFGSAFAGMVDDVDEVQFQLDELARMDLDTPWNRLLVVLGHTADEIKRVTGAGLTFQESFVQELAGLVGPIETLDHKLASIAAGSLVALGDGFERAAEQAAGAASFGAALSEMFVGTLASAASALGDFYIAQGAAAIAAGLGSAIPGVGHPTGFAAGAKYIAAGVAMKTLAGTMSGATGGGGRGGRGGGAGSFRASQRDSADAGVGRGTVTIIADGFIDPTNTEHMRQLKATYEALARGREIDVIVQPGRGRRG